MWCGGEGITINRAKVLGGELNNMDKCGSVVCGMCCGSNLRETADLHSLSEDPVHDTVEHKLDLIGVQRACHVHVDIVGAACLDLLEIFLLDEFHARCEVVTALVVRVGLAHICVLQLVLEQVLLVQEQDPRRLLEPLVVDHRFEHFQAFFHANRRYNASVSCD